MSEVIMELTDDAFDNQVLQNGQPTLVDFWGVTGREPNTP